MKLILIPMLMLGLMSVASNASACSIAPGYTIGVENWEQPNGVPPERPTARLVGLERGDSYGEIRTCGYIAVLYVAIESDISDEIAGFYISHVGQVPNGMRIPNGLLVPRPLRDGLIGFWFSWPEILPEGSVPPSLEFELRFSQVSKTGAVGDPGKVVVKSP